jgi:hypothetical protein
MQRRLGLKQFDATLQHGIGASPNHLRAYEPIGRQVKYQVTVFDLLGDSSAITYKGGLEAELAAMARLLDCRLAQPIAALHPASRLPSTIGCWKPFIAPEGSPIIGGRNYSQYCQIALPSVLAAPAAGLLALRRLCWASQAFS